MDSFRHKKRSKNQNKQEITNETDLTKTNQKKYNQDFLYSNEISNEISKENLSYDTIDFYSKDLKKTPGQFARSRQPSKKTTQTNKTFQSQYLSKQDPKNIQSSQRTLSPQNQFQDQEFNKIQQEYSPQINSPKTSLDDHQSIQDPFPKFLDLLNNFQNLIQNQNFLDQINILYQQVIDTKTQPNSKQNLVCTQIQQTYELIQMLISEKMLQIDEKKEIQSLNNTVKILVEKYQSEKQNISKNFTTEEIIAQIMQKSLLLKRITLIIEWVEKLPKEKTFLNEKKFPQLDLIFMGLRSQSNADPDQEKQLFEFYKLIWNLLRNGKLEEANELCENNGLFIFQASFLKKYNEFRSFKNQNQNQKNQKNQKNSLLDLTRKLWLKSCYYYSRFPQNKYQSALYSLFTQNFQSAFQVCNDWQDCIWVHFVTKLFSIINQQLNHFFELIQKNKKENHQESLFERFEISGLKILDSKLNQKQEQIFSAKFQNFEPKNTYQKIQHMIIKGDLDQLYHKISKWIADPDYYFEPNFWFSIPKEIEDQNLIPFQQRKPEYQPLFRISGFQKSAHQYEDFLITCFDPKNKLQKEKIPFFEKPFEELKIAILQNNFQKAYQIYHFMQQNKQHLNDSNEEIGIWQMLIEAMLEFGQLVSFLQEIIKKDPNQKEMEKLEEKSNYTLSFFYKIFQFEDFWISPEMNEERFDLKQKIFPLSIILIQILYLFLNKSEDSFQLVNLVCDEKYELYVYFDSISLDYFLKNLAEF